MTERKLSGPSPEEDMGQELVHGCASAVIWMMVGAIITMWALYGLDKIK